MSRLVKNNDSATSKKQADNLQRVTFRTSRELDFFSEKELVTQTGHPRNEWTCVIAKELIDNALDACEEAAIAPEISVRATSISLSVCDNGQGIPLATLAGVLDYRYRVSSREAYVAPDRGAQGNALKTIIPMPFVLDPQAGVCVVEAHGQRHQIRCRVDPITQAVHVEPEASESRQDQGTRVTVKWGPATNDDDEIAWPFCPDRPAESFRQSLTELLQRFAVVNPHLTLHLDWFGEHQTWTATNPQWSKWKPNRPTSSHWYTREHFVRLVAAYIAHGRELENARTVAEFLAEFDGLSGSQKRKQILDALGLQRAPLSILASTDGLDLPRVGELLAAMQAATRPIQPQRLGVIGETHFRQRFLELGVVESSFRYSKKLHLGDEGLPYVLESAFGWRGDSAADERLIHATANWSASIRNPFRAFHQTGTGLEQMLSELRAGSVEPIVFALHLAHPRLAYTDRGKSALVISD